MGIVFCGWGRGLINGRKEGGAGGVKRLDLPDGSVFEWYFSPKGIVFCGRGPRGIWVKRVTCVVLCRVCAVLGNVLLLHQFQIRGFLVDRVSRRQFGLVSAGGLSAFANFRAK